MRVIRLNTKWFNFEMESAGILFTVAFLFLTGGVTMLTENLWMYLFDMTVEVILSKQKSYLNEIIGSILLLFGFAFLFLSFRNWRVKVYSELYEKLQMVVHEYHTTLHMRERLFDKATWVAQHVKVHELYEEATRFVDRQKIHIDVKIAKEARALLFRYAEENEAFMGTIDKTERLINGTINFSYDPKDDFNYSSDQANKLRNRYSELENELRNKVRWKIN